MDIKIPIEIKMATHTYKVVFKEHLNLDERNLGTINHRTQTIELEPTLAPSEINTCLLHEIVHLIQRVYGCDLSDTDTDRLAQGMAEFLFNNLGIKFIWDDIRAIQ